MYLSSLFQAPLNGAELNRRDQDLTSDVATLPLYNQGWSKGEHQGLRALGEPQLLKGLGEEERKWEGQAISMKRRELIPGPEWKLL